jgi:hypothetical protein
MTKEMPRRCDNNLRSEEEITIDKAIELIEKLGADEGLTNAIVKLNEARDMVADYIDKVLIHCIGVDKKIHYCEPHSDKTICGVKVSRKKILSHDYEIFYWCCECDYRV